eukprot:403352386
MVNEAYQQQDDKRKSSKTSNNNNQRISNSRDRSRSHYSKQSASSLMRDEEQDNYSQFSNIENVNDLNIQSKDRNAFVTGLIDQNQQPHIQTQQNLDKCVDGIETQFQTVLGRHENDFVQAYRGHMQKVQKELVYLKNKANETAGKILNDDSITSLQSQIGWFKNEATKLDTILDTQKRELQKLKSRELNINEDRKFLKDQTKDAMKNNKLLQVALKKTQEQNKLLKQFLDNNKVKRPRPSSQDQCQLSPKQIINKTMAQFKEPFITQQVPISHHTHENNDIDVESQTSKNQKMFSAKNLLKLSKLQHQQLLNQEMLSQDSQDFKIKEFVLDLFKRGYSKEKIELKVAKFFKIYDMSRDDKIEEVQRKIEFQKRSNMRIKNSQAQGYSDKAEVENLFLDCIDECKKDLIKKKTMNNGQSQAKFQNNMIVEQTSYESQALIEQVTFNKEVLISVFEEIFGTGGYVGSTIGNLEHQIKQKKYSLVSQGSNGISYYSNATTKYDNQGNHNNNFKSSELNNEEAGRMHMIMNAPIENLLNNMSEYSLHQSANDQNNQIGIRKFSMNAKSSYGGNKRASTAIGGAKGSTQANTALTYYNDMMPQLNQQQKPQNLNQTVLSHTDNSHFLINNMRANTSHSQNRRQIKNNSNSQYQQSQQYNSNQIQQIEVNTTKSRQQQDILNQNTKTKSQDRQFSVRNGKLVMNNTNNSFKQ